jgi:F0F1-type ATP synthase membrane subunit b/b'
MDATLHALTGILLRAIPTVGLLLLLHFYLKSVFFKPLEQVLERRYAMTEGARKSAEESIRNAEARAAEYADQLRKARGEIYTAQEQFHKEMDQRHTAEVTEARQRVDALVSGAKAELASDAANAKTALAQESERLADRIAETVLGRRVA